MASSSLVLAHMKACLESIANHHRRILLMVMAWVAPAEEGWEQVALVLTALELAALVVLVVEGLVLVAPAVVVLGTEAKELVDTLLAACTEQRNLRP